MKKISSFLGLALVGSAALLLPMNAQATCGSGISFGGYYVASLQNTDNGPSLRGNFWSFNAAAPATGGGNPAAGPGNDNGLLQETQSWIRDFAGYGLGINGDWAGLAFDGCPDAATPNTADQRMTVSLSDVDGTGKPTFAIACVQRTPGAAYDFNFDNVGGHIALVAAPKATTTNWVRSGTNEATITVASPNFGAGFYTDGSTGCTPATVIPQYDVYKQQIPRNQPPDPNTDTGPAWTLAATGNTGSTVQFTTTCGTSDCDLYLAIVPRFLGGFTTAEAATGASAPARVSDTSVKLQAGPTLAETPGRGNKKIKNIGGTKTQQ
jgi:hypothetical protein